jgi:ribosomal protein L37AE/L43A
VFHHICVEEGHLLQLDSDDIWQCRTCLAKSKPNSKLDHGIFSDLLYEFQFLNPRAFQLPKSIRDQYENIFTHPITGSYMDDREVEIIPVQGNTNSRITRRSNENLKLYSTVASTSASLEEVNKQLATCFRCSRTDFKLSQTSFMNSHSVPSLNKGGNIQSQRSEIIQCDFCLLNWHLDCLDPPLASIPPELQLDEVPTLDIKGHSMLKYKLWNCSPLDQQLHDIPILPSRLEYNAADMHYFDNVHPDSEFLDNHRFIKIKQKWMCPCHADWETPKKPLKAKWSVIDVPSAPSSPSRRKRPIFKLIYHDPANQNQPGESATTSRESANSSSLSEKELKNNGWITIKNDDATEKYFSNQKMGVTYQIPESRIKFEFFDKINKFVPMEDQSIISFNEALEEKFSEFGFHYTTNVKELYQTEYRSNDFHPLVEKMISEEENIPKDLQEVSWD